MLSAVTATHGRLDGGTRVSAGLGSVFGVFKEKNQGNLFNEKN